MNFHFDDCEKTFPKLKIENGITIYDALGLRIKMKMTRGPSDVITSKTSNERTHIYRRYQNLPCGRSKSG